MKKKIGKKIGRIGSELMEIRQRIRQSTKTYLKGKLTKKQAKTLKVAAKTLGVLAGLGIPYSATKSIKKVTRGRKKASEALKAIMQRLGVK